MRLQKIFKCLAALVCLGCGQEAANPALSPADVKVLSEGVLRDAGEDTFEVKDKASQEVLPEEDTLVESGPEPIEVAEAMVDAETVRCRQDEDCAAISGEPPPCRYYVCNRASGLCEQHVVDDGSPCDDADPCTVESRCEAGSCVPVQFISCDDGNICTDDYCGPDGSCRHEFNTNECDDGDPCTVSDRCNGGDCVGGGPANCDDGNPCTLDECKPFAGCIYRPADGPCDDKNPCTTQDMCAEGVCIGGPPLICDDNNVCTDDWCEPSQGCMHGWNQAACDDGDPCTTQDRCREGKCVGGPPLDCDDQDPCTQDICVHGIGCQHPPVPEICNGIDDNCNGEVDEEGAVGCISFYEDKDGDGYGLSGVKRCLCVPAYPFTAVVDGDCDDENDTVFPGAKEVCDLLDNDCDGSVDEDPIALMCPWIPGTPLHGVVGCIGGQCTMASCDKGSGSSPGWYDLDKDYRNGCECQADLWETKGGNSCQDAISLGALNDTGERVLVSGNIAPENDEDWFVVEAVDTKWNAEKDDCDRFNLRIQFTKNPGFAFRFDVFRGSCSSQACSGGQYFEWATNFYSLEAGECNCSTVVTPQCQPPANFGVCVQETKDPFKCQGCPGYAVKGAHLCTDNSAKFYIRVRRVGEEPATCHEYEIEISNGLYMFSGG